MSDNRMPSPPEQNLDTGHKAGDGAKVETAPTDPKENARARRMEMAALIGTFSGTLDEFNKAQKLDATAAPRPFTLVSEAGKEISSTPNANAAAAKETVNSILSTRQLENKTGLPHAAQDGEAVHQVGEQARLEARDLPNETLEVKERAAIEKKYGVHVEIKDGKAEYHLRAGGKDTTLLTLPEGDIRNAEKYLEAEVHKREAALEKRYGARFSTDNSTISTVTADGTSATPTGNRATCRAPRLDELVGVEAALTHSEPSNRSVTGAGTEFYFLKEGQHYVENREGGANYIKGDPPKICIDFNEHTNAPTEIDRQSLHTFRSMEYDITHELAHNTQYRIGWQSNYDKNHQDSTIEDWAAGQLGWKKVGTEYFLEGKDHYYYKSDPKNPDLWFAYTRDKNGAMHQVQNFKTNSQSVREMAVVTPPTNYFVNPKEEMAECLTLYRLGPEYQKLLAKDPKLFGLIGQFDQLDINKTYPTKNNLPTHIRGSNGSLEEVQQLR
jgi:hypothetical protein